MEAFSAHTIARGVGALCPLWSFPRSFRKLSIHLDVTHVKCTKGRRYGLEVLPLYSHWPWRLGRCQELKEHPPHAGLGSKLFIRMGLAREFLTKFVFHSILWESPKQTFFFLGGGGGQPIWSQLIQLFGFRNYISEEGCLSPKRGVAWAGLTALLSFHYLPVDLGLGRSAPVVGNLLASDPSLGSKERVRRVSSSTLLALLH